MEEGPLRRAARPGEKMRTIGDNHMVASEVSRPRPDHAQALAYLALEMRAYLESIPGNGRQISW